MGNNDTTTLRQLHRIEPTARGIRLSAPCSSRRTSETGPFADGLRFWRAWCLSEAVAHFILAIAAHVVVDFLGWVGMLLTG